MNKLEVMKQDNWHDLIIEAYKNPNEHKYLYKKVCSKEVRLVSKGETTSFCYQKVTLLDILKKFSDPTKIKDPEKVRDIIHRMAGEKFLKKPSGLCRSIQDFFSRLFNLITFKGIGWKTSCDYATYIMSKLPEKSPSAVVNVQAVDTKPSKSSIEPKAETEVKDRVIIPNQSESSIEPKTETEDEDWVIVPKQSESSIEPKTETEDEDWVIVPKQSEPAMISSSSNGDSQTAAQDIAQTETKDNITKSEIVTVPRHIERVPQDESQTKPGETIVKSETIVVPEQTKGILQDESQIEPRETIVKPEIVAVPKQIESVHQDESQTEHGETIIKPEIDAHEEKDVKQNGNKEAIAFPKLTVEVPSIEDRVSPKQQQFTIHEFKHEKIALEEFTIFKPNVKTLKSNATEIEVIDLKTFTDDSIAESEVTVVQVIADYNSAKMLVSGNNKLLAENRQQAKITADALMKQEKYEQAANLYAKIISYHKVGFDNPPVLENRSIYQNLYECCEKVLIKMLAPSYGLSEESRVILKGRWEKLIQSLKVDENSDDLAFKLYNRATTATALIRDFKLDKDPAKIEQRLNQTLPSWTEDLRDDTYLFDEKGLKKFQSYKTKKSKTKQIDFVPPVQGQQKPVVILSIQGSAKQKEDQAISLTLNFNVGQLAYTIPVYAVFDGHLGKECAEFASKNIGRILTYELSQKSLFVDLNIWNALKIAFVRLDYEWQIAEENRTEGQVSPKNKFRKISDAGTTAVVGMIINNELWTANVGDSRGVFINDDNQRLLVQDLSRDAKPYRVDGNHFHQAVVDSIEKRGGMSYPNQRLNGMLGTARAIGIYGCPSVSARPKFTKIDLEDFDGAVTALFCSDGIFENNNISSLEAAKIVMGNESLVQGVECLIGQALDKGSNDDLTVVGVSISTN